MPKIVKFIPFELGPLPQAHITVLSHITDESHKRKQLYLVQYHCCNNTGELSYMGIVSRINGKTKNCISCGQKQSIAYQSRFKIETQDENGEPIEKVPDFSMVNVPWLIPSKSVPLYEIFPNQI